MQVFFFFLLVFLLRPLNAYSYEAALESGRGHTPVPWHTLPHKCSGVILVFLNSSAGCTLIHFPVSGAG